MNCIKDKIRAGRRRLENAIREHNPVAALILVSGGHDSLSNAWVSIQILESMGYADGNLKRRHEVRKQRIPGKKFEWPESEKKTYYIYHGNTTISIDEANIHVRETCAKYGMPLIEGYPDPKDHYDEIVREFGFPGSTRDCHSWMYRRLKERGIRKATTHDLKSSPKCRENILCLSGVRQDESDFRMGTATEVTKEGCRVWVNPIFDFSADDVNQLMVAESIPRNPVKDAICISGECMCGTFAKRKFDKERKAEIHYHFPKFTDRINELTQIAIDSGHPWPYGKGKKDWLKQHPPGQLELPLFRPMCVGCE